MYHCAVLLGEHLRWSFLEVAQKCRWLRKSSFSHVCHNWEQINCPVQHEEGSHRRSQVHGHFSFSFWLCSLLRACHVATQQSPRLLPLLLPLALIGEIC